MTRGACRNPSGPQMLVLAGRPPEGFTFWIFQPVVRLDEGGKGVTLASGTREIGFGATPGPGNWWRFVP